MTPALLTHTVGLEFSWRHMLASWEGHKKCFKLGGLNNRGLLLPFWRLEVWEQDIGKVGPFCWLQPTDLLYKEDLHVFLLTSGGLLETFGIPWLGDPSFSSLPSCLHRVLPVSIFTFPLFVRKLSCWTRSPPYPCYDLILATYLCNSHIS